MGNVMAPSLFSILQSAGAAGYGVATVNGAVQAAGAAVGVVGGVVGAATTSK